jgi:hypothetical protein
VSDGPPPFARVAGQLGISTWAYAALGTLIETGLLERVAEPRTARQLADHTRLDVLLVEVLLDVGLALGLVSRGADGYRANDEVLSVIQSPAGRAQRLFIRSDFLQGTDLLQRAHSGSLKPGWHYSDPDILNAQGIGSGGVMETICRDVVPTLDGLTERLSAPGAEFLDVGAGVGGICIALARVWPNLRVVALEPAAAPLKEAERNIGASAFAERIELRDQARRACRRGPLRRCLAATGLPAARGARAVDRAVLPFDQARRVGHRICAERGGRRARAGGFAVQKCAVGRSAAPASSHRRADGKNGIRGPAARGGRTDSRRLAHHRA